MKGGNYLSINVYCRSSILVVIEIDRIELVPPSQERDSGGRGTRERSLAYPGLLCARLGLAHAYNFLDHFTTDLDSEEAIYSIIQR